ncbi:MAG: hypothetical protein QOF30_3352 [Acidimicrobiaceae bacterium]|jgi:hypothetical protein|nr:hypothetical protein [Acidimicrobiaceae bacterium]
MQPCRDPHERITVRQGGGQSGGQSGGLAWLAGPSPATGPAPRLPGLVRPRRRCVGNVSRRCRSRGVAPRPGPRRDPQRRVWLVLRCPGVRGRCRVGRRFGRPRHPPAGAALGRGRRRHRARGPSRPPGRESDLYPSMGPLRPRCQQRLGSRRARRSPPPRPPPRSGALSRRGSPWPGSGARPPGRATADATRWPTCSAPGAARS